MTNYFHSFQEIINVKEMVSGSALSLSKIILSISDNNYSHIT